MKSLPTSKLVFNRTEERKKTENHYIHTTKMEHIVTNAIGIQYRWIFFFIKYEWHFTASPGEQQQQHSIALCIIFQSIKHLLHQRTLYQSQSIHLATIFSHLKRTSELQPLECR